MRVTLTDNTVLQEDDTTDLKMIDAGIKRSQKDPEGSGIPIPYDFYPWHRIHLVEYGI